MIRRRLPWLPWNLVAAVLLLAIGACGGGADRSKAQLRLINASVGYESLDLVVDGATVRAAVAYGGDPGYAEVDPEKADDTEIRRTGSSSALVTTTLAVSADRHYTLVAFGAEGALQATLLAEDEDPPDEEDQALVRVLSGAGQAGALDVYLTAADTPLIDAAPISAAPAAGAPGDFVTVDSGTWRLRITAAGDRDDLRLDVDGVVLGDRDVATLVLATGRSGVLVQALLVVQQAGVTRFDGAQARVRAVNAVTAAGALVASANGVSLMGGSGSPAIGAYRLVDAASASVAATVDGSVVAVPPTTLEIGGDYTLLFWGEASAAAASWIADDNTPASDPAKSRLRLVNGVASLAVPLALSLDFAPIGDAVTGGSATQAFDVAATTTGDLTVTGSLLGEPLISMPEQTLLAGGVYTLFATGAASAPTGVLFKDR